MEWDKYYRTGTYPIDPGSSLALRAHLDELPDSRMPSVVTDSDHNTLFLAAGGYRADTLSQLSEGLSIIDERAQAHGFTDRVETIRVNMMAYEFPEPTYDPVTINYFRTLDRLVDIKAMLKPSGVLPYQHHLRADPPAMIRSSTDGYRFDSNELLHTCLGLMVLYHNESTELRNGRQSTTAATIARDTWDGTQSYPRNRAYK